MKFHENDDQSKSKVEHGKTEKTEFEKDLEFKKQNQITDYSMN